MNQEKINYYFSRIKDIKGNHITEEQDFEDFLIHFGEEIHNLYLKDIVTFEDYLNYWE